VRVRRLRLAVLFLGALGALSAVAFPFAPVKQPRVSSNWSGANGAAAAAIPLMPYQPISLLATVPCDGIAAVGSHGVVRLEGSNGLVAELGRTGPAGVTTVQTKAIEDPAGTPAARDARLDVSSLAPGANAVRLIGTYGGTDVSLAFSIPRAPRTERMSSLVPERSAALLDWPVAFVFPCLRMASLRDGAAQLPFWRIAPPRFDDSGAITTDPKRGGPLATPRMLVRQEQVPVYLVGDILRDIVTLYRWVPITQFVRPGVTRSDETVAGWRHQGRTTVPGVDPTP
jgi:hypothetical protein